MNSLKSIFLLLSLLASLCAYPNFKVEDVITYDSFKSYNGMILRDVNDKRLSSKHWPPNIPVKDCKYNLPGENSDHFDCDDFAYGYKIWWEYYFPEYSKFIWTVVFYFNNNKKAHAINVLQVYSEKSEDRKFCFVGPQENKDYGCWTQKSDKPKIPQSSLDDLVFFIEFQYKKDDSSVQELFNETKHCGNAGEECFVKLKQSLKMYTEATGIRTSDIKVIDENGVRDTPVDLSKRIIHKYIPEKFRLKGQTLAKEGDTIFILVPKKIGSYFPIIIHTKNDEDNVSVLSQGDFVIHDVKDKSMIGIPDLQLGVYKIFVKNSEDLKTYDHTVKIIP